MLQKIYLNRHWPNRLCLPEAKKLPTKRLLTYYRKYQFMRDKFQHGSYTYHSTDHAYNSEFGTDVAKQINDYLDEIKSILSERENVTN